MTSEDIGKTIRIIPEIKGGVEKIQIENQTTTSIADAQQSLVYEPAKGYSIESRQKVKTVKDALLRIEVSFH